MSAVSGVLAPIARRRPASAVLHFRERKWVRWTLLGADIIALEISLLFGVGVRQLLSPFFEIEIGYQQFGGLALGILLLPIINSLLEMYPGYFLGAVERLRRRVFATLTLFGILTAWDAVFLRGAWSRGILIATFFFALAIPLVVEWVVRRWLIRSGNWGVPVIVLGGPDSGASLVQTLVKRRWLGLVPVAILQDDPSSWSTNVQGVPVVGPTRLTRKLRDAADVVLITMPAVTTPALLEYSQRLTFSSVILVPDLVGLQTQWVRTRELGSYLGLELRRNLHIPRNQRIKRFIDYLLGIPLLLAAAPVIGLLALCIRCFARGPAFYSQEREGLNGRHFKMWKLRTMRPNADSVLETYLETHPAERHEWNTHFKLKHDPRIIPVIGKLLRRTSLDELPQLWNVARGQMSLVGPRPFPMYHLRSFSDQFRSFRNSVLPGLTGFWQVSDRSDGDLSVQEALDTYYIRNWSVWLDVHLLIQTFRAVVKGSGAY